MAQTVGAVISQPQLPDRTGIEQPVQKGKVLPLPVTRKAGEPEQELSEQELVAVLSFFL
ncbi:MAG: hypothetical protein ACOY93_02010 [Bacillota bacterium]